MVRCAATEDFQVLVLPLDTLPLPVPLQAEPVQKRHLHCQLADPERPEDSGPGRLSFFSQPLRAEDSGAREGAGRSWRGSAWFLPSRQSERVAHCFYGNMQSRGCPSPSRPLLVTRVPQSSALNPPLVLLLPSSPLRHGDGSAFSALSPQHTPCCSCPVLTHQGDSTPGSPSACPSPSSLQLAVGEI